MSNKNDRVALSDLKQNLSRYVRQVADEYRCLTVTVSGIPRAELRPLPPTLPPWAVDQDSDQP